MASAMELSLLQKVLLSLFFTQVPLNLIAELLAE